MDAVRLRRREQMRREWIEGANDPADLAESRQVRKEMDELRVLPTSRSAPPRIFGPTSTIGDERTQLLVEQTAAVAPERLGDLAGHISLDKLQQIDAALRMALALD